MIGSGVLSLAWAIAQLGWIAGPTVMLLFSFVIYYTSALLTDCHRSPVTGKRNYTYMDAVRANLGNYIFFTELQWKLKEESHDPTLGFFSLTELFPLQVELR